MRDPEPENLLSARQIAAPPGETARVSPGLVALSGMQAEPIRDRPYAPSVMRHGDMRRAEKLERVVDGIGEARHAADVGTFPDAFGADRMMRRRRHREIRLPFRCLDSRRQEKVHEGRA